MNRYSRDMFGEMDEFFSRLFAQMQQEMLNANPPVSGYGIMIRDPGFTRAGGNIPQVQSRVITAPVAEVHPIDDEVKVITELPGAAAESIRLDLQGQRLVIDAGDPEMSYHTTADLPLVDPGSMQQSFRNSVLEVTFRLLQEPAPKT